MSTPQQPQATYTVDFPGSLQIRITGATGSAVSQAFVAMPVLRSYQWNDSTRYTKKPVDETRVSYIEAANCFMVGVALPAHQRCDRCQQGDTRFGECVIAFKADGTPYMGGCCAHCRYANHKETCSYHLKDAELAAGAPHKITIQAGTGLIVVPPPQALQAPTQVPVINVAASTAPAVQIPVQVPVVNVAASTASALPQQQPTAAVQTTTQGSRASRRQAALLASLPYKSNRTDMGPITMRDIPPDEDPMWPYLKWGRN